HDGRAEITNDESPGSPDKKRDQEKSEPKRDATPCTWHRPDAAKCQDRKEQGDSGTQHSQKHFTPPSYAPRWSLPSPHLAGYRLAADATPRRPGASCFPRLVTTRRRRGLLPDARPDRIHAPRLPIRACPRMSRGREPIGRAPRLPPCMFSTAFR